MVLLIKLFYFYLFNFFYLNLFLYNDEFTQLSKVDYTLFWIIFF